MIKYFLYLILMATIHALHEIQIEGKDGWAKKLPCFRINVFFRKLLGGKALTGYHVFMLSLFITFFHGMYLFIPYSGKAELQLWGFFCWYFLIEDFLWFIFNKHYGISKFRKGQIDWHKRWVLGLPISYWIGGLLGTLLLILGGGTL